MVRSLLSSGWRSHLVRAVAPLLGLLACVPGSRVAGSTATTFKPEEYRLLPVRIHLLRATQAADLNARLEEKDARRILGKINGIWKQAGLQFYPESILVEQAGAQELYSGLGANRTLEHLRIIRPRGSQSDRTFHLYYIRQMGPNGICFEGSYQLLFIKDTAALHPVPGGIDEPLPRVSAHEMGHALGLPHRQDTTNLMASGTTGTSLNETEIARTRATAERLPFRLTPAEALEAAARLEDKRAAADLLQVVATLPGEAAATARQRLSEQR